MDYNNCSGHSIDETLVTLGINPASGGGGGFASGSEGGGAFASGSEWGVVHGAGVIR